jgi:hypothetical protein
LTTAPQFHHRKATTMRQSSSELLSIDNNGFLRSSCIHPALVSPDETKKTSPRRSESLFDLYTDVKDESPARSVTLQDTIDTRKMANAQEWLQTILGLEASNVTQHGLLVALQNHAPLHVVKFMMAVNPKVMNIPKDGPTPLQVAVQNNAPLDVVQTLLEACPFGLCVTNPDHSEDPLSYAKRHHKDRPGLIELLSRPLSYWVTECKTHQQHQRRMEDAARDAAPDTNITMPSSITSLSRHIFSAMAPNQSTLSKQQQQLLPGLTESCNPPPTMVDREEIENVKKLCSQLLKAHRKMAKQVVACKNDLELQCKVIESMNNTKGDILIEMEEKQKHQFYRQLIALDMKEKAYKAKLRQMEKSHLEKLETRMNALKEEIIDWKESTRDEIEELQFLVGHEAKVNASFRNDLAEWMEEQHQEESRNIPSFVFATNLGEIDDKAPLCGNDVGIEVTLDHVKKRPWRPLFKHWDRIMLEDKDCRSSSSGEKRSI